eukprot:Amastigsp_a342708_10.p4 type:complete len:110 gc:universal Amastigsp_a342708_10:115-444(+)
MMPASATVSKPCAENMSLSSCGWQNRVKSCEPRSTSPSANSAATMASAKALGVRLRVVSMIVASGPGAAAAQSCSTKATGDATCSMTSDATTRLARWPESTRSSSDMCL